MEPTTNPNAELREALAKRGIKNGAQLARRVGSKAVIFFIRGQGGWESAHAELRLLETGETLTFASQPDDDRVREACVDRAVDAARELTGIFEWSKAPFSNCWLPSEYIEDLHEEMETHGDLQEIA